MGHTHANGINPTELRAEYGPAPWWSREHLRELLEEHGLTAVQVAEVWNAHPDTIETWARRHGLREVAR